MRCPKCNSKSVIFTVPVIVALPAQFWHNITKGSFRDRDVTIQGAYWDEAQILCQDCGWLVELGSGENDGSGKS